MNLNELLASPVGTLERMTLQIKGVGEYSDANGKGESAKVQLGDGSTQYPERIFMPKKPDGTYLTNADLGVWVTLPLTRKDNGQYKNVQMPWKTPFEMAGAAPVAPVAPVAPASPVTAPAQTLAPAPVASTAKAIRTSCSFNGAIRLAAAGKIDVTEVKKYTHFFDALLRDAINHEPAVVDNVSAQVKAHGVTVVLPVVEADGVTPVAPATPTAVTPVVPRAIVQPTVQLQDHAAAVAAGVAPPEEDLPF
jgi:hypothetical protein